MQAVLEFVVVRFSLLTSAWFDKLPVAPESIKGFNVKKNLLSVLSELVWQSLDDIEIWKDSSCGSERRKQFAHMFPVNCWVSISRTTCYSPTRHSWAMTAFSQSSIPVAFMRWQSTLSDGRDASRCWLKFFI